MSNDQTEGKKRTFYIHHLVKFGLTFNTVSLWIDISYILHRKKERLYDVLQAGSLAKIIKYMSCIVWYIYV